MKQITKFFQNKNNWWALALIVGLLLVATSPFAFQLITNGGVYNDQNLNNPEYAFDFDSSTCAYKSVVDSSVNEWWFGKEWETSQEELVNIKKIDYKFSVYESHQYTTDSVYVDLVYWAGEDEIIIENLFISGGSSGDTIQETISGSINIDVDASYIYFHFYHRSELGMGYSSGFSVYDMQIYEEIPDPEVDIYATYGTNGEFDEEYEQKTDCRYDSEYGYPLCDGDYAPASSSSVIENTDGINEGIVSVGYSISEKASFNIQERFFYAKNYLNQKMIQFRKTMGRLI